MTGETSGLGLIAGAILDGIRPDRALRVVLAEDLGCGNVLKVFEINATQSTIHLVVLYDRNDAVLKEKPVEDGIPDALRVAAAWHQRYLS